MTYKTKINKLLKLLESKDHFIDKLDLTDEQKAELKDFFKKHPNYESKIDWNNKSLQYKDFADLLSQEGKSRNQARKNGIEGLTEGKDYTVLERNDRYTLYQIISHLGSKTIAGPKVEPLGVTGKWCISMNDPQWWDKYRRQGNEFFFVCFKDTKFAISRAFDFPGTDNLSSWYTFFNAADTKVEQDQLEWDEEVIGIIESKGKITSGITTMSNGLVYQTKAGEKLLLDYDYGAIKKSPAIEWVVLPDDCTVMTQECLVQNTHIKSIKTDLNSQLKTIEPFALKGCSALHTIDFQTASQLTELPLQFSSMNNNLKVLLLPDPVKSIGAGAFSYCRELKYLVLPAELEVIRTGAFKYTGVKEVRFPENVREISDGAFLGCYALTLLDFSQNKGITCFSGRFAHDCQSYSEHMNKQPLVIRLSENIRQIKSLYALFESLDSYPGSCENQVRIIIESPLSFTEVGEAFLEKMRLAVQEDNLPFAPTGSVVITLKCPDKEVSVQNERVD